MDTPLPVGDPHAVLLSLVDLLQLCLAEPAICELAARKGKTPLVWISEILLQRETLEGLRAGGFSPTA